MLWNDMKAPTGEAYPVDLFLADVRTWLDATSESFASAWPHPAVTAGQIAYWPSGGHVHSYKHAAEILAKIEATLAVATKLDATETTCTPIEVINNDVHRSTGLGAAEYACYNPVAYSWCEEFTTSSLPSTAAPTTAVSTAAPPEATTAKPTTSATTATTPEPEPQKVQTESPAALLAFSFVGLALSI
jgi:hypothetical protein